MTEGQHKSVLTSLRGIVLSVGLAATLLLGACGTPEERAQSYTESGVQLLGKGDLTRAALQFRNALQLKNDFLPALNGLLQVETKRQNWGGVTAILSRIVELRPDDVASRVQLGRLLLIRGGLDEAVTQSEAAIKLKPDDAAVLALYAAIRLKVEDAAGAVEYATKALKADPTNVDATIVLVAERLIAKDPQGAIAFLDKAVALDETNVPLQLIKTQLLEKIDQPKAAKAVYQHLIALQPDAMPLRRSFALFLMRQKQFSEAETVFRGIAAQANGTIEPLLDVVRFLNTVEGHDAARKQLAAYVDQHPKDQRLRLALAQLSLEAGDTQTGKRILREIADVAGARAEALTALNRLTEVALGEADKKAAHALIAETLGRDKQNADALILRASLDIDARKLEKAIGDLRGVLRDVPDSVPALLLEARANELGGSNELAEANLAQAFRFSGAGSRAGLAYVQFLLRNGKVERAEDVLLAVLSRTPGDVTALKALAHVRLLRQNWLGAQEVGKILKQIDASDNFGDRVVSESLAGQQKFDQSIAILRQAYENAPVASRPLVALIRTYVRAGRDDDALAFLNNILTTNPDHYLAHILVGQVHLLRGDVKGAEAAFRQAIGLRAEDPFGYRNLFGLLMQARRFEDAESLLDTALKVIPKDVSISILKASLFEAQEKFEAAISIYQKLYAEYPNAPVIANNLASLLSDHRDDAASLKQALKLAERFRKTTVPYFKDTLGWANFRVGNTEAASSLLQEAVEQMPQVPIFRYHLGMSFLKNGKTDAARSEFEDALKFSKTQPFPLEGQIKEALSRL